eukprot:1309328-Amphidinium_carterae.1
MHVHTWLGAKFDLSKCKRSQRLDLLGVTFDFKSQQVDIKQSRCEELCAEISDIMRTDTLDPGHAAKLKGKVPGKLMLASTQLWGKVGKAFRRILRVLSERQYGRMKNSSLSDALRHSLQGWLDLLPLGRRRLLSYSPSAICSV